jgi:hypothetical protein
MIPIVNRLLCFDAYIIAFFYATFKKIRKNRGASRKKARPPTKVYKKFTYFARVRGAAAGVFVI